MRALRAVWTDSELALLKHLMWLAEPDNVNFREVAHHFPNHTWQGIQKRCACIRDLARRKERKQRLLAEQRDNRMQEPDSPTSVVTIPEAGRLHHTLVWVPPTDQEIDWAHEPGYVTRARGCRRKKKTGGLFLCTCLGPGSRS